MVLLNKNLLWYAWASKKKQMQCPDIPLIHDENTNSQFSLDIIFVNKPLDESQDFLQSRRAPLLSWFRTSCSHTANTITRGYSATSGLKNSARQKPSTRFWLAVFETPLLRDHCLNHFETTVVPMHYISEYVILFAIRLFIRCSNSWHILRKYHIKMSNKYTYGRHGNE